MADEISLKVTYVGNSLTLVASFLLIVGLVAVPSLRQTISSRIVLWIAVRYTALLDVFRDDANNV